MPKQTDKEKWVEKVEENAKEKQTVAVPKKVATEQIQPENASGEGEKTTEKEKVREETPATEEVHTEETKPAKKKKKKVDTAKKPEAVKMEKESVQDLEKQEEKKEEKSQEENVEIADELFADVKSESEKLEIVEKERKANKRLTEPQKEELKKSAFSNCLAAIVMVFYFVLLTLAYEKMQKDVFMLDLKVFSGTFLATAILLFENAYKKDSGKRAIHAIELLAVAIVTLLLTHIYEIANGQFKMITLFLAGSSIVYYCIKCLIMVIRQIRKSKLQDVKNLLVEKV